MSDIYSELRSRLPGQVWFPGEPEYSLTAPWDQAVTVSPRLVVAARSADDIAVSVRAAGRAGLRVVVQATGHGAVPAGEDCILVYTAEMAECVIDPAAQIARIGPGVTGQQLVDAAASVGLSANVGSSTNVGTIGYLSGGGIGPLARPLGASSDQVVALELITGDGEFHRVDVERDGDLFWAVRGGKSLLGIVTAVELRLLPIKELWGGSVFFAGADLPDLLPRWRDWAAELPDGVGTSIAVLRLPALPYIPPPLAGAVSIAVRYAALDPDDPPDRVNQLTRSSTPIFGGVSKLPAAAIGSIHADPTVPTPTCHASTLFDDLGNTVIDRVVALTGQDSGSPQTLIEIRQLGGALNRAPAAPSSFSTGNAAYNLYVTGDRRRRAPSVLTEDHQRLLAAVTGADARCLVNFTSSADPNELRRCYAPGDLQRLGDLAGRHDSAQVFARPLVQALDRNQRTR